MRGHTSLLATLLLSCAPQPDASTLDSGLTEAASLVPQTLARPPDVLAKIAADRRQLEASGPGVYSAHIAGVLHAELSASGLLATADGDTVGLATVGYGARAVGGAEPELGACAPGSERVGTACVRQVELAHGELTEWWVSRVAGLEQGWTLYEPPADGQASIRVRITEGELLSVDADGQGAWLAGSTGGTWRYGDLAAWDADGALLDLWLEPDGPDLRVRVDTAGASWPVTVDPSLFVETKLTASDGAADDRFGWIVSSAGDLDGDGYDDLIVGAYDDDDDSGSAYVYYGSASGIDRTREDKLTASDRAEGDLFGISVSSAGDLDGDGYDDLVVGAYADSDNGSYSGSAYVYYGSASGIDSTSEAKLTASDGAEVDLFGGSVSGAGDLDGDGYDDLVVGAYNDDDNGSNSGSAYVYYGSASGIDRTSEAKLTASDGTTFDYFGGSVSGAGDLDGDGYDDLVVGAFGDNDNGSASGSAYVYYGSSSGIDSTREAKLTASDGATDQAFGFSVSGAGDLDGDGYDDLVVGAFGDNDNGLASGSAYVYYGSSSGIDSTREAKLTASDGAEGDRFGMSVSGAGDLDSDGYDDLVVGAEADHDNGWYSGSAYVYYGSSSGIDSSSEAKLTASDGAEGDWFGDSVSSAGDLDGDGYDDLVVGAYRDDDNGTDSGSVYVFAGACRDSDGDGWCPSEGDCDDGDVTVNPNATELCDGADNDCDGTVDNDDADDAITWYADADADGYGNAGSSTTACTQPTGYVGNTDDCDDTEPLAWTGATELCDGADNDCDGTVDNDDAADASTWYADSDGDGFTDEAHGTTACEPPSGYAGASESSDCDDSDATVYPGADEIPNDGVDQDCDGVDEPSGSCGCANSTAPTGGAWLLLGLMALVGLRRRELQRNEPR